MIVEVLNNLLQFCRRHLTMSKPDTNVRYQIMNHSGNFFNIFYTVVYKKDLTTPGNFFKESVSDQLLVKAVYFCVNRLAVGRRGIDYTKISRTHQGKLKGSGNRCGC